MRARDMKPGDVLGCLTNSYAEPHPVRVIEAPVHAHGSEVRSAAIVERLDTRTLEARGAAAERVPLSSLKGPWAEVDAAAETLRELSRVRTAKIQLMRERTDRVVWMAGACGYPVQAQYGSSPWGLDISDYDDPIRPDRISLTADEFVTLMQEAGYEVDLS